MFVVVLKKSKFSSVSDRDQNIGTNYIIYLAQFYFMVVLSLESAEIQQLKQKHKVHLKNNKQY